AYSSLLALVPMLAVVFSVATSILKEQGEAPIRQFVEKLVAHITPYTNPEQATNAEAAAIAARAAAERERAVKQINEYINRIRSGTIGTTGTVALMIVAITMLVRIEEAFNDIWGVGRGRSWYSRTVLYWAALTLGPLLLIVALGLTSGAYLEATERLRSIPGLGGLVFTFLPGVVLSGLFALFYLAMPNTRVPWQAALAGGLVAGTLWQANNALGVFFVSRITSNNAIYGSLGMVPVFMIGLYFAWLILLFGAQVAHAFQNRAIYSQSRQGANTGPRGREWLAWRIMTHVGRAFARQQPPPTVAGLAPALHAPAPLVAEILRALTAARLTVETTDRENGFVPARPLEQITAHEILTAVRDGWGAEPTAPEAEFERRAWAEFQRVGETERRAAAAVTLAKLVAEDAPSEQVTSGCG
ncbi:MAG TPA: YhjD/YihY/BrkB family envelope integrity protein, partial [Methylomirabilota bacterium]|nr:YhjD/YihY/BrkB family envelope integrity protein [Methylomirabilota bacterium]